MKRILLINGPNLNLLGKREPEIYGVETLADIVVELTQQAMELGYQLTAFQSNAEHELIDKIQQTLTNSIDFILINPGGFTHTSICLRDALLAVKIPFIEIHISNLFARETFRQRSFFSDIAIGTIAGLGVQGYALALQAANTYLKKY